ncbi:arginyltransferase [Neokomagataea tanensis]|uniref:arginyltransferase n=1 Tax=Neokomagataea TaxID=1223423 RepID=UPI00197BB249|nr:MULTISPECIES: arginyltransferase [Neokomagataea]
MQHRPQLFYTTDPAPCPYLPGRLERKLITALGGPDADLLHDRLALAGFRRSHSMAYTPACANCRACMSLRIPVKHFQPNRTQQKLFRRHSDISVTLHPPIPTEEQFNLFQIYQTARHADGEMVSMSWDDYSAMIAHTPIPTYVVEFRTTYDELVCVSLIDALSDGLSAVYTFYNPTSKADSWGTYSILWLIHYAKLIKLPQLYLGYYVPGSPKMAYKARFEPAEVFHNGHWGPLPPVP